MRLFFTGFLVRRGRILRIEMSRAGSVGWVVVVGEWGWGRRRAAFIAVGACLVLLLLACWHLLCGWGVGGSCAIGGGW